MSVAPLRRVKAAAPPSPSRGAVEAVIDRAFERWSEQTIGQHDERIRVVAYLLREDPDPVVRGMLSAYADHVAALATESSQSPGAFDALVNDLSQRITASRPREIVSAAVRGLGAMKTSRILGVSREAVLAYAGNFPRQLGTDAVIEQRIERLNGGRPI